MSCQLLDESGAVVDAVRDTGATPLLIAAIRGHVDCVRYLASRGGASQCRCRVVANGSPDARAARRAADVNVVAKDGATPLTVASLYGHADVIRVLAEFRVSVTKRTDYPPALFAAAERGHTTCLVELLKLDAGIKSDADWHGESPLFAAAQHGHVEAVRLLVEGGASVNRTNHRNESPLLIAAKHGHLEVVKLLVARGADVHQIDNAGMTTVFAAAREDHPDIVEVSLPLSRSPALIFSFRRLPTVLFFVCRSRA